MSILFLILGFLVFPGILFTAALGLLISWLDRKLTARVQMRRGPRFLQPLHDIRKLLIKETCVPEGGSTWLFLSAPLIGFAGVSLASMILWRAMLDPAGTFAGDLIVVLYLLTMPALAMILGAFASQNPLASLGGSREMKLILSYELPLVLSICVVIAGTGSVRLGEILAAPAAATSLSGLLALLVALIALQAKLTRVPFDLPEAETELSSGVLIEYSGPPLAMYKLTQAMMLFTGPVFLVVVFCGGVPFGRGLLPALGGVALLLVVIVVGVLIRNTAPRLRIDQAMRLLWGPVTVGAVLALLLLRWSV